MTVADGVGTAGCIPVLGMHRSGTSALTLMLSHLGVSLPSAADLGYGSRANVANTRGFWEPRLLVMENESILRRNGGSWRAPPELSPRHLREVAGAPSWYQRLLVRYHSHDRPWVWKDPRLCLTLDFWDQIVNSRSAVLMFRHPWSVADSLARRDGMSIEQGFALWEWYVASSLQISSSRDAIVVFNSDLVSHPDVTAGRLQEWLAHLDVADGDLEKAVRSIDRSLMKEQVPNRADMPAEVSSLWDWLKQAPARWTTLSSSVPAISESSRRTLAELRDATTHTPLGPRRVIRSWGTELAKRALGRGSSRQLDEAVGVE